MHSLTCTLLIAALASLTAADARAVPARPAPTATPTPARPAPTAPPTAASDADNQAAARHAKRTACLKEARENRLSGAKKTAFLSSCLGAP